MSDFDLEHIVYLALKETTSELSEQELETLAEEIAGEIEKETKDDPFGGKTLLCKGCGYQLCPDDLIGL